MRTSAIQSPSRLCLAFTVMLISEEIAFRGMASTFLVCESGGFRLTPSLESKAGNGDLIWNRRDG
jgi:hypothetical protein